MLRMKKLILALATACLAPAALAAFSASRLSCTRNASSSVMSASSWLVTAGITMALRVRLAPLIFWMRPSSLRSTGQNLAKSTLGHGIRPSSAPAPPPDGAALLTAAMA